MWVFTMIVIAEMIWIATIIYFVNRDSKAHRFFLESDDDQFWIHKEENCKIINKYLKDSKNFNEKLGQKLLKPRKN